MKEDLLRIINNYGINNQLKKLNEECFEFIEAVKDYEYQKDACEVVGCKDIKEHLRKSKEHLEEEFADVCVVLEQFKAYYNLDNDKIIEIMKQKINRQLKRIEREKEEENYN